MKNVLLLVHDDDGQEARLQAALDLTRALGGHLSCLDVALYQVASGDYYYGAVAEAMVLNAERDQEAKNKAALEARLAHEDVPWDWTDVTGSFAEAICDAAILSDMIVLSRKLDQAPYPDMREAASRVLMHARTPILAVPETCTHLELKHALVAWDGQTSCAATLRACVPLLKLADTVEIFMVRDGSEKIEPSEAAAYLSRHDIHASVNIVHDGLTAPDKLIEDRASTIHADYIVMGAYSHGRLMETFGGVTKRMLGNAEIPLILGH